MDAGSAIAGAPAGSTGVVAGISCPTCSTAGMSSTTTTGSRGSSGAHRQRPGSGSTTNEGPGPRHAAEDARPRVGWGPVRASAEWPGIDSAAFPCDGGLPGTRSVTSAAGEATGRTLRGPHRTLPTNIRRSLERVKQPRLSMPDLADSAFEPSYRELLREGSWR